MDKPKTDEVRSGLGDPALQDRIPTSGQGDGATGKKDLGMALTQRFLAGVESGEFQVVALSMEPVTSATHLELSARYETDRRLVVLVAEVAVATAEGR